MYCGLSLNHFDVDIMFLHQVDYGSKSQCSNNLWT